MESRPFSLQTLFSDIYKIVKQFFFATYSLSSLSFLISTNSLTVLTLGDFHFGLVIANAIHYADLNSTGNLD